MFDRLRRRSAPSYEELVAAARASDVVGLDETGHRQDGTPRWMWLMRTDRVSVFRVELSRGGWVAEAMLGATAPDRISAGTFDVFGGAAAGFEGASARAGADAESAVVFAGS